MNNTRNNRSLMGIDHSRPIQESQPGQTIGQQSEANYQSAAPAAPATPATSANGFIDNFNRIMSVYGYYPTNTAEANCKRLGYKPRISNYLTNYSYCDIPMSDAELTAYDTERVATATSVATAASAAFNPVAGQDADAVTAARRNAYDTAYASSLRSSAIVSQSAASVSSNVNGANVQTVVTNQNDMNQILQGDLAYINRQKEKLKSSLETKNRLIVLNDNQRKRNVQWIYITVVWVITLLAVLMIILMCKLLPEWFPCNLIIGILISIGCILTIIILTNLAKRDPMNYDRLNLINPTLIDSSGTNVMDASGSWGIKGCIGESCCDTTSTTWNERDAICRKKEGFDNPLFLELVAPTSMPYTPFTVEKYKSR